MNCPKCDADIGDSYEPNSAGIYGGWYCDSCQLAVREHERVAGDVETMSARELVPPDSVSADDAIAKLPEKLPAVAPQERSEIGFTWNIGTKRAAPARHYLAPVILTVTALALSSVGIAINGWFARSLGSTDFAGWLFLAIGVAADLAALVLPNTAAGLWQAGQRATALIGWVVWAVTFVFALTAGIGFASTNISDITLVRASRGSPAVKSAQAALTDAMAARDRECKGGVGKFCREREGLVAERRQILDAAMTRVGQEADPQTDAAIKLVAWGSGGMLRPVPEDFAMLRLILLALLPQIGGMLLMISRRQQARPVLPQRSPSRTGQRPQSS